MKGKKNMDRLKNLRHNIYFLRTAYGFTQEQLANELDHFEDELLKDGKINSKKTKWTLARISHYETGARAPSRDALYVLSKFFEISQEELVNSDFSGIGIIEQINPLFFWERIGEIIPIIKTDKGINNAHFKKAIKTHKEYYIRCRDLICYSIEKEDISDLEFMDSYDDIGSFVLDHSLSCLNDYYEALAEDPNLIEACANSISIVILMGLFRNLCVNSQVPNNQTVTLNFIKEKNERLRKLLEDLDREKKTDTQESDDEDVKALSNILDSNEIQNYLFDLLAILRKSSKFSDIAYYYLSLIYLYDIIDDNTSGEINRKIGIELLSSLCRMKNRFARRYRKILSGIVTAQ